MINTILRANELQVLMPTMTTDMNSWSQIQYTMIGLLLQAVVLMVVHASGRGIDIGCRSVNC